MNDLRIVTSAERPDLEEQARAAFRPGWPEFIFHDPVVSEAFPETGSYVVPDALHPVSIDCEAAAPTARPTCGCATASASARTRPGGSRPGAAHASGRPARVPAAGTEGQ
jgi:hypothetical protein